MEKGLRQHKSNKRWMYTGLATMTVLGGIGAAPSVLADQVTTTTTTTITETIGPAGKTRPVNSDFSTNVAPQANAEKQADKAKEARDTVSYTFGHDDFTYTTTSSQIQGLSATGKTKMNNADWDGVLKFKAGDFTGVTSIFGGVFSYYPALKNIDFTNLSDLQSIGNSAFANTGLTELDLSPLTNLVYINSNAFGGTQLTEVNLDGLEALTTIGDQAFSSCPNLKSVNLSNLNALTTIGKNAFSVTIGSDSQLDTVTLSNLDNLTTIGERAFYVVAGIKTTKLENLPSLAKITSGAFGEAYYSNGGPELPDLHQIFLNNINPTVNIDYNVCQYITPRGQVIPNSADDLAVAERFVDRINEAQFGLKSAWYIPATVTLKYVDQDGKELTTDVNNKPVDPQQQYGKLGNSYKIGSLGALTIAGYDKPTIYEDSNSGRYNELWQEVTLQYKRSIGADFTVYYVDDKDNEIIPAQQFGGYADEKLTLDPNSLIAANASAFSDYDFKELYGSSATLSRAVQDFAWATVHNLIGTEVKYGDNNGRSYKLVFTKKAKTTDKPASGNQTNNDNNSTNNKPSQPSTGTNNNNGSNKPSQSTPNPTSKPTTTANTGGNSTANGNKKPSSGNTPTNLPVSGGEANVSGGRHSVAGGKQTVSGGKISSKSTNTPNNAAGTRRGAVARANGKAGTASKANLPQSGTDKSYWLPVFGATVLIGLIGLYAFAKKNKLQFNDKK
ncbi:leucine-rich repeat protein [Periweissella cryptocerci]|nr:leucine-rich repeat protein [Periweissella cryptocerci]